MRRIFAIGEFLRGTALFVQLVPPCFTSAELCPISWFPIDAITTELFRTFPISCNRPDGVLRVERPNTSADTLPALDPCLGMDLKSHWDHVYETKKPDTVSWYEHNPSRSVGYIQRYSDASHRVMGVGAGASLLTGVLLDLGYANPIALDVSGAGLEHAEARLGERAKRTLHHRVGSNASRGRSFGANLVNCVGLDGRHSLNRCHLRRSTPFDGQRGCLGRIAEETL